MNTCGGTRKRKMKGGNCGCSGGGRRGSRHGRGHTLTKKRGGSMVGDAILAGTAVGLYKYFTKKSGGAKASGGSKRLPVRKTRKEYV